ncbi:MAG: bifunctional serine/threonine-protein kinase/formylglycine-generating enzyme family protein [Sandaracinaceae bacterium]
MPNVSDVFELVGRTVLGNIRIDAIAGGGGFGVVYRAFHESLEEPVAVKLLRLPMHLDARGQESFRARFRDEAKLMHRLSRDHRAIVQVYDFGTTPTALGETPYLVLEWLQGRDLKDEIDARRAEGRPPMTPRRAVALMKPALEAVAFAHDQNIAHRDIKPANLYLTRTARGSRLKVLDFGIAKVLEEGATPEDAMTVATQGHRPFSPTHAAPEQLSARSYGATGPWTDVHALGLILSELITGRPPFEGPEFPQYVMQAVDAVRPTPRAKGAKVGNAFEAVCRKALALQPADRYPTARALLEALEEALAEDLDQAMTLPHAPNRSVPAGFVAAAANAAPSSIPPSSLPPRAGTAVLGGAITGPPPPLTAPSPGSDDAASRPEQDTARDGFGDAAGTDPDPPVAHASRDGEVTGPLGGGTIAFGSGAHPRPRPPVDARVQDSGTRLGVGGSPPPGASPAPPLPGTVPMAAHRAFGAVAAGAAAEAPGLGPVAPPPADTRPTSRGPSRWLVVGAAGALLGLLLVGVGVLVLARGPFDQRATAAEMEAGVGPAPAGEPGLAPVAPAPAAAGEPRVAVPNRWVEVAAAPPDTFLGVEDPEGEALLAGPDGARLPAPTVPFEVQQHEVTWQELTPFLAERPEYEVRRPAASTARHPATGVPRLVAEAYCADLGGRLPTEAEWEWAARGPSRRAAPWGDGVLTPAEARAVGAYRDDPRSLPDEVGTHGADVVRHGDEALFDLAGNAREWTAELFRDARGDVAAWIEEIGFYAVRGLPMIEPFPETPPRVALAVRGMMCEGPERDCHDGLWERLRTVGFRCVRGG